MCDWADVEQERAEALEPPVPTTVDEFVPRLSGRCDHGFLPGLCEDKFCRGENGWSRKWARRRLFNWIEVEAAE